MIEPHHRHLDLLGHRLTARAQRRSVDRRTALKRARSAFRLWRASPILFFSLLLSEASVGNHSAADQQRESGYAGRTIDFGPAM